MPCQHTLQGIHTTCDCESRSLPRFCISTSVTMNSTPGLMANVKMNAVHPEQGDIWDEAIVGESGECGGEETWHYVRVHSLLDLWLCFGSCLISSHAIPVLKLITLQYLNLSLYLCNNIVVTQIEKLHGKSLSVQVVCVHAAVSHLEERINVQILGGQVY